MFAVITKSSNLNIFVVVSFFVLLGVTPNPLVFNNKPRHKLKPILKKIYLKQNIQNLKKYTLKAHEEL